MPPFMDAWARRVSGWRDLPWHWPLLGILLLPAASRWWLGGLPAGPDHWAHLFRAVQLDQALGQGIWYPRWAADLVFGYGYPIFNLYGPAAHYLIAVIHRLGLDFVSAALAAYSAADVIGAAGAFVLGRALFGTRGGLLSAVAFAYAPYTLLSLERGALPEALGLALLPWLVWSLLRILDRPEPQHIAGTAALVALLPFVHNPSVAVGTALSIGIIALHSLTAPKGSRGRPTLAALGAIGLGLLTASWFLLPVAAEVSAVHIERAFSPPLLDFHFNFLAWTELLALPQPYDPFVLNGRVPHALGWPQIVLALCALPGLRRMPPDRRMLLISAYVGVIGLALLTLPESVSIWERLPGLGTLQFPWRLLGPAGLLLAVIAGSLLSEPTPAAPSLRAGWLLPAIAIIVLYGLPWTFTKLDRTISPDPTVVEIQDHERRTRTIGTSTAGEYLPIWVEQLPDAEALREAYASGSPIRRLNVDSLPAGARVLVEESGYTRQRIVVESPVDFTLVVNAFYYPGWTASVNGARVAIEPTPFEGLISFRVGGGTSEIVVDFGTTPPRGFGAVLSLTGVATIAGLAWRGRRIRPASPPHRTGVMMPTIGLGLAVVGFAFAGMRLAAYAIETPFLRIEPPDASSLGLSAVEPADPGAAMSLMGMRQSATVVAADDPLTVDLYWRALRDDLPDLSAQLTIRDAGGRFLAQSDTQNLTENRPTSGWQVDQYARNRHILRLIAGAPPGTYSLYATLYRQSDQTPFAPPSLVGSVTITCPQTASDVQPQTALGAHFGAIEFIGVDWPTGPIGVGEKLTSTAYWVAHDAVQQDITARMILLDQQDRTTAQWELDLVRSDLPTTAWQTGCPLSAVWSVGIPADLLSGTYAAYVEASDDQGSTWPRARLGTMTIVAPERSFVAPAVAHPLAVRFGEVAELTGWGLDGRTLTLVWRALHTAQIRYTRFVHVLGDDDSILSQVDSQPLAGTRPTTSWLAGEYLTDALELELGDNPIRLPIGPIRLPIGPIRLRIGLYDQATGQRLTTDGGEEYLVLMP